MITKKTPLNDYHQYGCKAYNIYFFYLQHHTICFTCFHDYLKNFNLFLGGLLSRNTPYVDVDVPINLY